MSFPRYPTYKASGLSWLVEVPTDWLITKTKHVIQFTTGWTPPTGDAASFEGENLWANISDLGPKYLCDTSKRISNDAIAASRIKASPEGSLLFSFKLSIGQVSFAGRDMYTNEAIATFLSSSKVHLDYAYYAFPILLVQNAAENIYGAKLLNQELIRSAAFALPTLPEQYAIASFLDRETAKIDELIAEQQRLIELLKEKRQAVISHAVIKGLDPEAPLSPSGVVWFGDIPSHWVVTPLKWLTDPKRPIMYGIVLPGPDSGEGIPILKGGNIRPSRMNLQSMARTTPEIEAPYARARLKGGDLVYSIRGTIGDCEPVPVELEGSNITQDVARVAVADGVCAAWVRWALLASAVREELSSGSLGAAVRGINIFDLKRADIPTPPPSEQIAIATFLNGETMKLERLISEAERAIDLLTERREALISVAITGQIDVRELAEARAA